MHAGNKTTAPLQQCKRDTPAKIPGVKFTSFYCHALRCSSLSLVPCSTYLRNLAMWLWSSL